MYRKQLSEERLRYLALLAQDYPTVDAAAAAIINLQARLKLPKGTEHFMSDIHGEYEAFTHILNNASGVIREKVDLVLGDTVPAAERADLATLIYYPAEKLQDLKDDDRVDDDWYALTLYRLILICRQVSSKYPRGFVRQMLPANFTIITDELLHAHFEEHSRERYYDQIMGSIIEVGRADAFICAVCELIKKLAVYKLHIVGDIYDRGARPDVIIDKLMAHHSVDLQWGNHDILWMGAAAGSEACIASAINISLGFGNTEFLEEGYGIPLRPLAELADKLYAGTDCSSFAPLVEPGSMDEKTLEKISRMHKVIAIITFKVESAVIRRNPEFGMDNRLTLPDIDFAAGTVVIDGVCYPMMDTYLPTIDPADPEALSAEEAALLAQLRRSFVRSERLARHVRFLFSRGSVYRIENGNLLYHGALPMEPDGSFTRLVFDGREYCGRELLDYCEARAREGYFAPERTAERRRGRDFLWYLWCGPKSPIYGRAKMSTFENLLVGEPGVCEEKKDPYYDHTDSKELFCSILEMFGLDPEKGHVINGHVPVLASRGEAPVKAGGKLIVVDGGFCRAYHKKTGTAGYTLVYSSHGMSLRCHKPFESTRKAIEENRDIDSTVSLYGTDEQRILVGDTDEGAVYKARIQELKDLLAAYRAGIIKEG